MLGQKRVKLFLDTLHQNQEVWDTFEKFNRMNKEIQMRDIPSLEPLIKEIFIDRTILFIE